LRYMGFEGRALSCRRGGRLIFHDLSFSASAGSISLILGPNGSGKTTLIECIAGILPFKGDFVLDNRDFTKLSSKAVAYAPQDADEDVIEKSMFDEISLSARAGEVENLLLQCSVPREVWTGELAGNIALKKVASVIAAIARGRELCLLDEPTLSCNWAQKQWIVNAINKYRSDGGTVLISSHDSMFLELLARSICI
jgi:ABC-type Mn2+/Zn2+ transport system ATPase subunit